jgi:hypothetical protein
VAALLEGADKPGVVEDADVLTGGGGGDASGVRQLADGPGPPVDERHTHRRAALISENGSD